MKLFLKSILALSAAALLFAGCAKEKFAGRQAVDGELTDVTFTAQMENGTTTKAVADGDGAAANVNRCIMEIYYGGELFTRMYAPVSKKKASFTVCLVSNRTYTVAFWADSVANKTTEQGLSTDLYYTTDATQPNGGLQAIALKGTYIGNDDARDAFFHCEDYTVAQGGSNFDVTLKRPFAQMNVITTDWDKVSTVSSLKPDKVNVTIKSPLTVFNAVTGIASADPNVTTLTYEAALYTSPAPVQPVSTTEKTLSMDYLFATTTKEVIDIDWKALHGTDAAVSHSFTNIPYQRNYRTNIKGALLTTTGQWNVTVDPIWESSKPGEQEIVYDVVNDIQSANVVIANEITSGKKEISVKFTSQPNDAGTPGTVTEGITSKAIVTTNLPANGALNILVEAKTKDLYIGDYESETNTTVVTSGTNAAIVNVNVPANSGIQKLVINAPSKTVFLNGILASSVGVLDEVDAVTSQNTLIVQPEQTITELTMRQGGLEIHGTVGTLVINESAHDSNPVKVRKCENLSQEVFDVIKGNSPSVHNYIDIPYYVEKDNGDGTWDIVPADPVAKIGETKYFTLADAVAAANATTGATIELLKDVSIASSLTIEKDMTLDLDEHKITSGVTSGRPLLVKSNTSFTIKDGVFVDGTSDASYGIIDTRIGGFAQSNVTLTVTNVDAGIFDENGNCTSPFNTNNGAIFKFRSTGTCVLTDVRAASDHYILDNTGVVSTTVTRGKYIVNHPSPCGDSGCSQNVAAFNLPYGTNVMTDVIVTTTNCKASVACGNTSGTACNLDISGCNFTSDQNAIAAAGVSVLNVTSGTYTATGDAVRVMTSGGTVNISGGTFVGTTNALFANVNTSQYSSAVATINVSGGKIKGNMTRSSSPTYINLYGGIYSVEPSTTDATIAFGFKQAANPDAQTSAEYPWTIQTGSPSDSEVSIAKTGLPTAFCSLAAFRDDVNAGNSYEGYTVTLLKDVTYSPTTYWTPIGYMKGTPFSGTFNGNGHKVEGLNIDTAALGSSPDYWPGGFFGCTFCASISNLTLYGQTDCAGFAGIAENTSISDCVSYMNSDLCYNISGGFIAHADAYVTLTNCKNYGNFICKTSATYCEVGGLVGRFYGGDHCSVTNCENHGNISWKGENGGGNQRSLGGIVAGFYNFSAISNPQKCVISGCKNYGAIYNKDATSGTTTTTLGGIGGIVGKPFLQGNGIGVTITNCINEGSVISSGRAGGIIGTLNEAWQNVGKFSTVSDCTNSGTIYGTDGSRGQIYGVMSTNQSDPGKDTVLSNNTESGTLKAYGDYSE